MQRIAWVAAAIAAVLISLAALEHWRQRSPAEHAQRLTERLAIALDLDPDQKAAAWPAALALVQEKQAMDQAQSLLAADLQGHLCADDFDLKGLGDSWGRDVQAMAARHDQTLRCLQDFHNALRPDQRAAAAELLQRFLTPSLWDRS
ncbi:MAG TPA: hypothetical protein VNZ67_09465 [bacterium]|nr:hypothetical protein [bacterium]